MKQNLEFIRIDGQVLGKFRKLISEEYNTSDGCIYNYEGEIDDNKRNGYGTYVWSRDGSEKEPDKYEGEWLDDQINGKGVMYYKNGSRFEGEWLNYKKHRGIYYDGNGGEDIQFWFHGLKLNYTNV